MPDNRHTNKIYLNSGVTTWSTKNSMYTQITFKQTLQETTTKTCETLFRANLPVNDSV